MNGLPIVISAPSGAGKSTIASQIARRGTSIVPSVSCTTRPPRAGEKEGEHYFFTTVDDFKKRAAEGGFLEWAVVHGQYYGTPLSALEANLRAGRDVILTIDPQGALSVKKIYPKGVFIFVVPPSWDTLHKRLYKRATDDANTTELRLQNARKELTYVDHYDYLVVNDDLDAAVNDILAIIRAEHQRLARIDKRDIPILTGDF